MPFYRIVIWTTQRQEPFTGIRQLDNYNIDAVQHIMRVKAEETYRRDFIDVEVQMISKTSTAVRKYLKDLQKKRERRKDLTQSEIIFNMLSRGRNKPSWRMDKKDGPPFWHGKSTE